MSKQEELFDSIQKGEKARMEQLLEEDGELASSRNAAGVSAVMWAMYHRQEDLLPALYEAGATPDLFDLCAAGDVLGVQELLDGFRAAVDGVSGDGFSPLHLACYFDNQDTVRLLLERAADPNAVAENGSQLRPLHSAVAGTCGAAVTLLLRAGAEVNAKQQGGWTALHAAAKQGDLGMVRSLLKAGASVTEVSENGQTASDLARENGAVDVLDLLSGLGNQAASD